MNCFWSADRILNIRRADQTFDLEILSRFANQIFDVEIDG